MEGCRKTQINMSEAYLFMWVVYERPLDYPDYFVIRRWWMEAGKVWADPECALFETLEEARASLPEGLYCLGRNACDQPQIREVWL